jgi:ABC-2 type transport system ATP-binding protein
VEATCQRVLILNEGRIVAQGTREEMERGMRGEVLLDLTLKPSQGRPFLAESLMKVTGVQKLVSSMTDARGIIAVRLSLTPDAGGEEAVFDWAVAAGMKIVSMVPQRLSLEDIFLSLTKAGASA